MTAEDGVEPEWKQAVEVYCDISGVIGWIVKMVPVRKSDAESKSWQQKCEHLTYGLEADNLTFTWAGLRPTWKLQVRQSPNQATYRC